MKTPASFNSSTSHGVRQIGDPPESKEPSCRTGLCSKGICPGTLLLAGFLIVQGLIALISWIRA